MTEKPGAIAGMRPIVYALACLTGLAIANVPGADAAACPPDLTGVDRCTSNDLQPTGAEIISGPAACTDGELVTATIRVYFENGGGASERYNVGFFIGDNGELPVGGASCTFDSLQPVGNPTNLTSGSGPFLELNGDSCGDLSKATPTYRDIETSRMLCKDDNGDGLLDFSYVLSWDNNGNTANCTDPLDPSQFTPNPPKCRGDIDAQLPLIVEPPPAISVAKAAIPDTLPAPGGEVTYYFAVHNDSSASDPVTINSLVDAPYGNLAGRGTCRLPAKIAPGETYLCSFTTGVSGAAGTIVTDTVTVQGTDDEGEPVSGSASATVSLTDIAPTAGKLRVFKFASPHLLPEPGGTVRYTVIALNPSLVTAKLQSLQDNLYGNLDGLGNCRLPQTLRIGSADYLCQFSTLVTGQPGDTVTDVISAEGTDINGNALRAEANASVFITNLNSKIVVRKTPIPSRVEEPRGDVNFDIQVRNLSAVDEVTLRAMNDSIFGNLDGRGSCSLPQTLPPAGGTYRCNFTALVSGNAGDTETNEIAAVGIDDDGDSVADRGSATVLVVSGSSPPTPTDIRVIKTPSTNVITEPGAGVTFSLEVLNDSPTSAVILLSLVDSIYGNLNGQGTCSLPVTIPAGGAPYSCEFRVFVGGQAGSVETNVVRAEGEDPGGNNRKQAYDFATVVVRGTPASLEATKTPSQNQVVAPGESVQFVINLSNTSPSDTVTIDALTDTRFGDLNGQGTCVLPQSIPAGGEYSCGFNALINGNAGDLHVNRIVAAGTSDDGDAVSAQAAAAVRLVDAIIGIAIPLAGPGLLLLVAAGILTVGGLHLKRRRRDPPPG